MQESLFEPNPTPMTRRTRAQQRSTGTTDDAPSSGTVSASTNQTLQPLPHYQLPLSGQPQRRFELEETAIEVEVAKLFGSGSNYTHTKFPQLLGASNWAEFDEALQNAARAEH